MSRRTWRRKREQCLIISNLFVVSSTSEKVVQSAAYGTGSPCFQSG